MKKAAITTLIFLFSISMASAQETEYINSSIARLSFLSGNTYVQKASDIGFEEGVINMPITEGDRIGTTDGRAEIHLGLGNYIRLDHNTKVDIVKMPNPEDNLIQFQIWSGNVYMSIRDLEREKDIEIHTPDVSVYVLDIGLYRIDVRPSAETEIFVFNGLVETAGESGSLLIKDEQRIEACQGYFTTRPTRFFAVANDSFDRWSENRDAKIEKQFAQSYLPEELEDYGYELYGYGDWIYVFPYGWVWVPARMGSAWRPYHYGRWTWLSLCGWTWLPAEPWGWMTFHYGYWHWSPLHGWYWIPGSVWGPAWVSWYWGYDYIGWAPQSYWGYPGVIINNVYYGRYTGDYPGESAALTVIHKNQLKSQNVSKVALERDSIRSLGRMSLDNNAPPIRPAVSTTDIKKLDEKQVILRKNQSSAIKREANPLEGTIIERRDARIVNQDKLQPTGSAKDRDAGRTGVLKSYPPSPKISSKNQTSTRSTSKPSSAISRIYERITKSIGSSRTGSSQSTGSRSTSSGSGKISSRAGSSSSSRATSSRSSSSKSSSRATSRVKKKKSN
jgi:hypothetical protein